MTVVARKIRERGMLFSKLMVLALLAGTKLQTRRAIKFDEGYSVEDFSADDLVLTRMQDGFPDGMRPVFGYGDEPNAFSKKCPYGQVGDRIWVRETWQHHFFGKGGVNAPGVRYAADNAMIWHQAANHISDKVWRPSLFMPRWASRILLEITEVRVERLNEISEEDAIAEGINLTHTNMFGGEEWEDYLDENKFCPFAVDSYKSLWEKINGLGSWARNEWVWVVCFKVVTS